MQYTILAIRDFPDLPIGWRSSYLMFNCGTTLEEAIEMAYIERNGRGGKYGYTIYEPNGGEVGYLGQASTAEFIHYKDYHKHDNRTKNI